jgi:hypothetical protein
VDSVDRGQHRRRDHRGADRCREAGSEQRAASGFGGSSGDRVPAARAEAEALEHLAGRVGSVPAEPAEQLLRPVADEESADGCAE